MQVKEEMFLQIRRASEMSFRNLGWNWDSEDLRSGTACMSAPTMSQIRPHEYSKVLTDVADMFG
jgi:hypothetical protein